MKTIAGTARGKKSYSGTDETRLQIVRAAANLFSERGYEATSIRDIENAAGVSRGGVTYHIGNKEEIWKAAFEYTFFPFLDQVRSNAEFLKTLAPSVRFRHLVGLFVRASARSPQMVRFMIHEGVGGSWRFEFIVKRFFIPLGAASKDLWAGSTFLELFRTNPHLRYALLGACNLIFAVPTEVKVLFRQDVYSDTFIDTHIDAVVAIFESFGQSGAQKPGK